MSSSDARVHAVPDPPASPPSVIVVRDPARGDVLREIPVAGPAAVKAAVERARSAQPSWGSRTPRERARVLRRAGKELVRDRAQILEALERETGKPRVDVVGELMGVALELRHLMRRAPRWLARRRVSTAPLFGKRGYVVYRPRGVIGVISPWNAPLHLSLADALPALFAGNAVVIKPSEITPLAVDRAVQALGRALPDGILQVVHGAGSTGAALVDEVDMICVTGSSRTGHRVMERAARRLTPVLLELGGKDPMIVLRDADLDRAARAAAWGGCLMSGQVCMSVERVYVEKPVAEEFTEKLLAEMRTLRVGVNGPDAEIDLGPFISDAQIEIVERHVQDARDRGAEIPVGGRRVEGLEGNFYEPTVVRGVDHDMAIMREETFGPVVSVMEVDDWGEAIRLANDSEYGLNASVWTRDVDRGIELAQRIDCGSVCINDCVLSAAVHELPFGGSKSSGLGIRHGGPEGLRQFCAPQALFVEPRNRPREGAWFPYSLNRARWLERVLPFFFLGS